MASPDWRAGLENELHTNHSRLVSAFAAQSAGDYMTTLDLLCQSLHTLTLPIDTLDQMHPQTQMLLRKHTDVLPRNCLADFDLRCSPRGEMHMYVETLPRVLIQRTLSAQNTGQGNVDLL